MEIFVGGGATVLFQDKLVSIRTDDRVNCFVVGFWTQISIAAFAGFLVLWVVISTATSLQHLLGRSEMDQEENTSLVHHLTSLIGDRDQLLSENQRLREQLQQLATLVHDQSVSNSELRHELVESRIVLEARDASDERPFQTSGVAVEREVTQEGLNTTITDPVIANQVLLQTVDQTIVELRNAHSRISELEGDNDQLRLEMDLQIERTERVLTKFFDSLDQVSENMEALFESVGLSPGQLSQSVQSIYGGLERTEAFPIHREDQPGSNRLASYDRRLSNEIQELRMLRQTYLHLPFNNPLDGSFPHGSGFGPRRHPVTGNIRMHSGLDYPARIGTPVYATGGGTVTQAGWLGDYGITVTIQHIGGVSSRYAHLRNIFVSKDQSVSQNDRIGAIGSTGVSTAPHLHYEILVGGSPVDPKKFMVANENVH